MLTKDGCYKDLLLILSTPIKYREDRTRPKAMEPKDQLLIDCFVYRISSRSDRVFNNPEEPEGEDEDVSLERVRTANALTSADFQEVTLVKQANNSSLNARQ